MKYTLKNRTRMSAVVAACLVLSMGCKRDDGLRLQIDGDIAVTVGDFDHIAAPLERMVVAHTSYEGLISTATWDDDYEAGNVALKVESLWGDDRELSEYGLLFVASGTRGLGLQQYNGTEADDQFLVDNDVLDEVEDFVGRRGVLVVSDWGYDLVEKIWPDQIEFFGDDESYDAAQVGSTGTIVSSVDEAILSDKLGMDSASLEYNFSNWSVIESVSEDVTVWMSGDIDYRLTDGEGTQTLTDVPLLVSMQPEGEGKGTVVFSTFHFDAQTPTVMDEILRNVVGELTEQQDEPVTPIE